MPDAAWLDCAVDVGAIEDVRPLAACAYENGVGEACSPADLLTVDVIVLNVAGML